MAYFGVSASNIKQKLFLTLEILTEFSSTYVQLIVDTFTLQKTFKQLTVDVFSIDQKGCKTESYHLYFKLYNYDWFN